MFGAPTAALARDARGFNQSLRPQDAVELAS
jgi:hypothetical protein